MLAEIVRNAHWCVGDLPLWLVRVLSFDPLDALLELTDVAGVEVEPTTVGLPQRPLKSGDLLEHPVEDAVIGLPALCALLRRAAGAEQHLEDGSGVTHHG